MNDGAESKFERHRSIVKLSLEYTTWDSRLLRFGVKVSPRASISDIIAEAQKRADEQLEYARFYLMYQNGSDAFAPWMEAAYQLKPSCIIATTITIKTRNGTLTAAVPTYHHELWQRLAHQAIPDSPLTLHQTDVGEFTAFYEDEMAIMKARYVQAGVGEEHEVKVLPMWEDQTIRVREAFGRDMIPEAQMALPRTQNSKGLWHTD
jgi:hypothetical protein